MIPLIPLTIATLVATSYAIKTRQKPMTDEQRNIYHTALKELKDPDKLEILAKEYVRRGFKLEGRLLKKRADYIRLPPEAKAEYRKITKNAFKSQNRNAVLALADRFEDMGCTGTAWNLRRYGQHLLESNEEKAA